jgi:hypothetical protein
MIPSALGALLLNVITQGMCVRGVNRLTTVSISLRLVMRLMAVEGKFNHCQPGLDDT